MIPPQYYPGCSDEEVNEKCYYRSFCPALAFSLNRDEDLEAARYGAKDGFHFACAKALVTNDASELVDINHLVRPIFCMNLIVTSL